MPQTVRVAILGLLLAALINTTHAEDWPTWRHDHLRTGATGERVDPPLTQVWAFRSRQSRVAPKPGNPTQAKYPWVAWYTLPISAAGDALFFTSAADGRIVCLDAASGKMRWEFHAGCGVNRVPTIWKGKVYAGSHDGNVYCLDAKTGSLIWTYKAAPADRWFLSYGKPVSVWPVRTDVVVDADPAIYGGKAVAYFAAGVFPHDGTFLYAVDAETGQRIWRNATHAESGWRASMAPAGHLYVSKTTICVPRDFWGYFSGWGTLVTFDRATGLGTGYRADGFWPVHGAFRDKVRYFGTHASKMDEEDPNKQTAFWKHDSAPGRWIDLDSVLGVRYKRPVFFRWDPDAATVIYAGGIVYYSAFETDANKAVGSGIYARDAVSGKLLWSADVAEQANQIIVANGRLFAATRQGTIYCFAPKGAKEHGVVEEPVDADPLKGVPHFGAAAETILERTGVKAGYAVVLDCQSGALAYELAKRTKMYVLAVFPDADEAAAARNAYGRSGMHVSRVIAYHQKDGAKLPFSSYIANLIVSEAAVIGGQLPGNTEELNRMLKPIRGVALIGGKQSQEALKKWIGAEKGWEVVPDGENQWARRVRPALENPGGWTHALGDAGNTGCSHDGALKPPLGIYWYGEPQLEFPGPGALMIDGIFLLCEGDDLVARDEYTGRETWRRGHGRTDTVCAPGSVFLRYLEVIVRLDPDTGKELHAYKPPFPDAQWLAMATTGDGKTLYLVAGADDWRCMMAADVATGKIHWTLGGPGKPARWGGWNAIGLGYIYMLGGEAKDDRRAAAIAEMRAYLKATDPNRLEKFEKEIDQRDVRVLTTIDAKTGKVICERGVDITNCGGRLLPHPGYGSGKYARHYNPNVGFWMMARKDVVVFGTASGADKGWGVWPTGRYKQRGLAVHDGATGRLLWNRPCNYRTRPVIVDETIYAEPWGYDLRTGKRKTRVHPITGKTADWAWCRADKQCGVFSASTHFLFGRSLGVGYHDLLTDSGLYTFWHSRMSCSFDAFSGGGMMIKPPNAVSCRCTWSLPFTIALGHVPMPPTNPQAYPQPGPHLPVKHIYLDMGASGDRRDRAGNLWIHNNHGEGHALLLPYPVVLEKYPGAEDVRRSALYTSIENADAPFVFASTIRGLKRCVLPVNAPDSGSAVYKVKLGFSALPGDKPGSRVFDVKLDGKVVLKDFDIIKETGKADRAVWREFTLSLGKDLTIELVANSDKPTVASMPLINGVVMLRQ